jgi:hypothetical protein
MDLSDLMETFDRVARRKEASLADQAAVAKLVRANARDDDDAEMLLSVLGLADE